ncbi:type VI secretion system tip protein VgrG, partial [Salmonella enterica subsp. enterica serovar Gatineau]|nr:type VI secretion system tip protein VgrG [Salmonella enterica subsp. enterica serovar Gatineau]MDR7967933.1 type VI secretion system tip protein VgrG [Salmonella enterica subsp. enterica serovar Gatineau]MDR7972364.1 type VI secretion system tip protein VgrG [Salmonella enterica subsp. enterica serovar Gatineau]
RQPGDTARGAGSDSGLPQRRPGPAHHHGAHLPPGKPLAGQPAGHQNADDHPLENL